MFDASSHRADRSRVAFVSRARGRALGDPKASLLASIVAAAVLLGGVSGSEAASERDALARLAAGDYGGGLRSLAEAAGIALPQAPAVGGAAEALALLSRGGVDVGGAEAALAQVPDELRGGVETLLVGMARADLLVRGQVGSYTRDGLRRLLRPVGPWVAASRGGPADPAPVIGPPGLAGIDLGAFVLAEILLLDAVREALPVLVRPATAACPTKVGSLIWICSPGDDVYDATDDAILIIDQGGDDVYENAQGTPFGGGLAQVIVDLGGNDRYERSASAASGSAEVVAQGAGVLGIGGIVDVAGDDSYLAEAFYVPGSDDPDVADPVAADVIAQGAGALGAGFLIDLGGVDDVEMTALALGGPAGVTGQGGGSLGVGFAAFLGSPVSRFTATSEVTPDVDNEPDLDREFIGPATTVAHGGGLSGIGAFIGGADANHYHAESVGASSTTIAQGAGNLGAGALVDLGGADIYFAKASTDLAFSFDFDGFFSVADGLVFVHLADTTAVAQGAAVGGVGVALDQGGGKDELNTVSLLRADGAVRVNDRSGSGIVTATSTVSVGRSIALAHGAAESGVGLLEDSTADGDDTRTITSDLDARAIAIATGGASNTASASTTAGDADANGQGSGQLFGAGALADAGGSDEYRLVATHDATASATGDVGKTTETLVVGTADTAGQAQGGSTLGIGSLLDLGGSDTYTKIPGTPAAADDTCYTNSPPGNDLLIGLGIDADPGSLPPAGCLLPSH